MIALPIDDIISRIEKGETFAAAARGGPFSISLTGFVPCVCTALHHGHALREELEDKIALTPFERWQEEDPHTGDIIGDLNSRRGKVLGAEPKGQGQQVIRAHVPMAEVLRYAPAPTANWSL